MNNETKVGLLVVIALGALAWLSVQSGSFNLGMGSTSGARELKTAFADVGGLMVDSPVKVAGVQVGKITAIKLQPNGTASVHYTVDSTVPLPSGVVAEIASDGLIGSKFLALVVNIPGTTVLPASATDIPGRAAADVTNIGGQFAQVAADLQAITGTLKGVLGTPENAQKLQTIIDGIAQFSGGLDGAQTGDMLANFNQTAASLARITAKLEAGEGTLGQLLVGDNKGGNMMTDLNGALKDLRQVMAKINQGDGTLGKLVNDPQTAEKLNDALDTFSDVSNRINQLRTEVSFEGSSLLAESGAGQGSIGVTLQPRPTRFYALAYTADGFAAKSNDTDDRANPYYNKDFGKESKITAQFGHIYKGAGYAGEDVAFRIGLKNSSGGLGVDTAVPLTGVPYAGDRKVKLSADLYDFSGSNVPDGDTPQLDVAARMDLVGNTVYGVVGYDNLLNQEYGSPKVGVGFKFQDDDLKYIAGQAL